VWFAERRDLSQGVGNLIFVPITLAVGRRPVFLGSCALLFVCSIIASQNTNYTYHLAVRVVMGFAAGQSEALVPLMIKETFFLHERANVLAFQAAFQTIVGCILTIFASNIAASVGWKNWYSIYAGLSAAILIASVFLVIETKYDRPMAAYAGLTPTTPNAATSIDVLRAQEAGMTKNNRPSLDLEKYTPRSVMYDLNPMPAKVEWWNAVLSFKHMGQMVNKSHRAMRLTCADMNPTVLVPRPGPHNSHELLVSRC
jgi:MFS family permease